MKKEIDNSIKRARHEVEQGLRRARVAARREVEAEFEDDIKEIKSRYSREINRVYELFNQVKAQLRDKDGELQ